MALNEYRTTLQTQLPQMLQLLEQLVNIDSGSYVVDGVNAVGQLLAERLEQQGFALRRRAVPQRGDLLVAERQDGGRGKLTILGHLDTVWPEGTVREWGFRMLDNGLATGPGVGDMKGGLVMALHALQVLRASEAAPLESIKFVLVPDEELGSVGSRTLIEEEAAGSDVVLVLEPGRAGGGIVTARGKFNAGDTVQVAVRPSALRAVAPDAQLSDGMAFTLQGRVGFCVNLGNVVNYEIDVPQFGRIMVEQPRSQTDVLWATGQTVRLTANVHDCVLLER